jgi:hypothetical protein
MNKLVKIGVAALIAGTATVAAAQQRSPTRFGVDFAYLQSLSGNSASQFYHPAPKTFSRTSQDPATPLTVAEMQRKSDNHNALYAPDEFNVHPDKRPTFAQTNRHGLPFSFYQAASSNSDEWKVPADGTASGSSAVASATTK